MSVIIGILSGIIILFLSALLMGFVGWLLKVALKYVMAIAYLIACVVLGFMATDNGFDFEEILVSALLLSCFAFPLFITAASFVVAIEYGDNETKIATLQESVEKLTKEIEELKKVSN